MRWVSGGSRTKTGGCNPSGFDKPFGTDGSIAILTEISCPDGAVVKAHCKSQRNVPGNFKCPSFDCEEDAIHAVLTRAIKPGDAVFIRFTRGPKGKRDAGKCSTPQGHCIGFAEPVSIALSQTEDFQAPPRDLPSDISPPGSGKGGPIAW